MSVFPNKYCIIKERHCLYFRISTILWRKDTVCIPELVWYYGGKTLCVFLNKYGIMKERQCLYFRISTVL